MDYTSETMSLSDAIKTSAHKMLFDTLLKNPEKRAQVLELLTQEGLVGTNENSSPNSSRPQKYCSPIKKLQKNDSLLNRSPRPKTNSVRLESPSALGRRRALQRLESDSSEERSQKVPDPQFVGTPKPFERLLEGVVAFCEIRSNGVDRSVAIKTMMQSMGAKVKDNLCRGVTHVVLKDGLYTTYRKAKLLKVHVVSVLWLEAVRRNKFRVPESNFPAVCADAYDADITKICQDIQKDYNDVIQDELNKTSQSDNRRHSESPKKFITERRKSISTGFKEAHNRTEIAAPYKFKCNDPELSESDSYISVGSNSNHSMDHRLSMDIIPSSQDPVLALPLHECKSPELTKISEEDPDENVPESNLAKYVKDSFELKKAAKIRSPESIHSRSKQTQKADKQQTSLEEDSLRLQVSITDESSLNNTGNKSKSHSSAKNLLEMSSKEIIEDDISSLHLHISDDSNFKHSNENNIVLPKDKLDKVPTSTPSSDMSQSSSDPENKNKTRRRTVGLKKPTKKNAPINDTENNNISNKLKTSKPNKSTDTTASLIEIDTSQVDTNIKINTRRKSLFTETNYNLAEKNVRKTRRKTMAIPNKSEISEDTNETNDNVEEENVRKTRRKTMAIPNDSEISEDTNETNDNVEEKNVRKTRRKTMAIPNDSEISEDTNETNHNVEEKNVRKTRRKTMAIPNYSGISEDTNEKDIPEPEPENTATVSTRKKRRETIANVTDSKSEETNKKPEDKTELTSDSSAEKKQRRVRKLYDPNQVLSLSQINWNEEEKENKSNDASPPKKVKYHVPIKELPKVLSAKAQKVKPTPKSTAKSVPAKPTTTVNKNKRKAVRTLNFDSSEASDNELDNQKTVQTPVRKSERIAKTPAKKTIISSSGSTDTSQTPKTIRKPLPPKSTRTQLLKTSPRKRRSTLDFIPTQSKKTLEEVKLSQKKRPLRLPGIVCTRLHKDDVHIFEQIVKKIGGFFVEEEVTKRTTHLIAGAPSRTVNMLKAIARGCWVLRHEWLFKSLEAGKWLQEEDFELVEFSPTVQKCRLERQSFKSLYSMDIFNSCGAIFISRDSTPRCSDLEELVQLCGGRVVRFPRDAQVVVAAHATHEGVLCVNEKWIMDSITCYKLKKYNGYLLQRETMSADS